MARRYPSSLLGRPSFLLGKLHARSLELEARELGPLGIDVKQHAVLCVLAGEGPMTQRELGQRLGIDRTTIVAVVDGLDGKDFIERRRSPADRRAYLLTMTPSGEHAQQRGQLLVDAARRTLLDALDESERRALTRLLARALEGP
ncbi:MAG: MarR family winged helix-turn-helix transcriptional regulator [Rubrobacteraceae bacterium]